MSLSTHVLDTARGEPARGVRVRLERAAAVGPEPVAEVGLERAAAVGPEPVAEVGLERAAEVELERAAAVGLEPAAEVLATAVTDADGRIREWPMTLAPGVYRLVFDTGAYLGDGAFFPEVVVTFVMADDSHHHVPLLLSPYGYSTYRGS
jgi:5-hydroxyisourate hydrolase